MGDLLTLWRRSAERLERRLTGLHDTEFFWQPVPNAWTVFESPQGWTYQYEFAPPPPAPVTTIAWRMHHIAANNWIYWEYAFGAAKLTFPDLTVHHTAADAIASWQASAAPIVGWLEDASEEALNEMRPNHGTRPDRTAGRHDPAGRADPPRRGSRPVARPLRAPRSSAVMLSPLGRPG